MLPWKPHLKQSANDLNDALACVEPAAFAKAVKDESLLRHREFTNGIARYQNALRKKPAPPPAVFMTLGTTRLLDFSSPENGIPLLIVPSLINRYRILDLSGKRSFVRALTECGFQPYLVDWGAPGDEEINFDLSDYITRRLEPMLEQISKHHSGKPVSIIGYCMGGLLALALALRTPDRTQSLALLATPWDFHTKHEAQTHILKAMLPQIDATIDALGEVPVDVLQAMFTSLNPWSTINKFRRFSRSTINSDHHDLFVELEDWLNDGTVLAGPVARECLHDWYVNNAPRHGKWQVCGTAVKPDQLQCPSFAVIPKRDHIVPPGSAMALVHAAPSMEFLEINSGHIGMITGNHSKDILTATLSGWFLKQL